MKIIKIENDRVLKICLLMGLTLQTSYIEGFEKKPAPLLQYTISMHEPSNHLYHVTLFCSGLKGDTIDLKMPRWMPGYYQIMNYADEVKNFTAGIPDGRSIPFIKHDNYIWRIIKGKNSSFNISYDVYADRKFVASNLLDTTHGYIVTAATFMYIDGHLDIPVNLKVLPPKVWKDVATGLSKVPGKFCEFTAPDFDIFYDCPILIGNLEKFRSFEINGISHHFFAYNPGNFNRDDFISGLRKTVLAGINLIGEIPYDEYIFIGIGPGYGGIEHLNNATVSFDGNGLEKPGAMIRALKFLGHEYFHNYNVKRIRPLELGPFKYDRENRTNLLWVSEGLTVYYEYLILKRAGLMSDAELLASIESNINAFENDAGRQYQSLSQASYETWDDGPFGNKPGSQDKSISCYDKGPLIGIILDFSIRNATQNRKSLDDVMRLLYRQYYKKLDRGFTDAEFQQACQDVAGISLSREFEYVYTTKEIDYSTYLSYAGLKMEEQTDIKTGKRKFTISGQEDISPAQAAIFNGWCGK